MNAVPAGRHIVIVGGGISGLGAAYYLQQHSTSHGLDARYTLLEASGPWGGKVMTEQVDGFSGVPFLVEAGPDSFLIQKPWALQLARELDLSDRLLPTNDQMRQTYVLRRGRPVRLPDGLFMIVPTKFVPFALSPLISPFGKLRMALDWFIPARRDDRDETLAAFVRRRLGEEALDTIAEPLMSGIYSADADRQSILATFPRFRQLEREHGSLIRGMLASRRQSVQSGADSKKSSPFMSLAGGTQELIDALVPRLTGDLRLDTAVQSIEPRSGGGYNVTTSTGETLHADAVILTVPAYVAAKLVRPIAPSAADKLASIRYITTGTISLAYRTSDIKRPLGGFGLVVPKGERRPINAITISSSKFAHRGPDGCALLRVFFGGSRTPQTLALDDTQLLEVVRGELRAILGIEAAPLFHRTYRWPQGNPQYDVDHLDRVAAIEGELPPDLYVTGSAYRGVGLPDCVHHSQQTAQKVIASLQQTISLLTGVPE